MHRMILESFSHPYCSFVTLTYGPEKLPPDLSLDPSHTRDWLKRLRHLSKVRYFLVGEYGDESQRPHYHVALFGHPPCVYGRPPEHRQCTCSSCEPIHRSWGFGITYNGELTPESAGYIAQYVTKKMTSKDDPRLLGRHPEFARMSLRPGIGAVSLDVVLQFLESEHGAEKLAREGDVPDVLQHGRRKLPLGRYLRSQLRKRYGFPETSTPKDILEKLKAEMHQMYAENGVTSEDSPWGKASRKYFLTEKNAQKVLNMETRSKIKHGGLL